MCLCMRTQAPLSQNVNAGLRTVNAARFEHLLIMTNGPT